MMEVKENCFYSVKEIADGLKAHVTTIRKWIQTGQINAKKIGRSYIVPGEVLLKFLKKGTIENKNN